MTWWLWMIVGAVIVLLILFVWSMCIAAGDADKKKGYK